MKIVRAAVTAVLALVLLALAADLVRGHAWDVLSWYPCRALYYAVIAVPVLLLAIAGEVLAFFRPVLRIHPATATAAAFMLFFLHPFGADTSTAYDGAAPRVVVAVGYLLLATFLESPGLLVLTLEPIALVTAAWCAAWLFPNGPYERASTTMLALYYLPAIGVPASAAAALILTTGRLRQRLHSRA